MVLLWKACQAAVPCLHLATAAMGPSAMWPFTTTRYSSSASPVRSTSDTLRRQDGIMMHAGLVPNLE